MNKGFSLVELIVVIAIMAILVGVAVPVYTSYIDKAETAIDMQYTDEVERALETVRIEMKAGISSTTENGVSNDCPSTSVKIVDGVFYFDGNESEEEAMTSENSLYVKLVNEIVTIGATFDLEYSF